jgi:hypothetical protein
MTPPDKKTSFFRIGLVLFPIGLVLNTIFLRMQVGGLLRELSRLATLVGFFLIVFGGIYRLAQKRSAKKN